MRAVVRGVVQCKYRRQNSAAGVPVPDDRDDGTADLDHRTVRTDFPVLGHQAQHQNHLDLLRQTHRATGSGKIFGKCPESRQHLESTSILHSYRYGVIHDNLN